MLVSLRVDRIDCASPPAWVLLDASTLGSVHLRNNTELCLDVLLSGPFNICTRGILVPGKRGRSCLVVFSAGRAYFGESSQAWTVLRAFPTLGKLSVRSSKLRLSDKSSLRKVW